VRQSTDVVVVGGGIGGAALATLLARHGVAVTVLERQRAYQDRVRGEVLAVWGVAEAQRLGVVDVLLGAGGALVTRRVPYDEAWSTAAAEAAVRDNGRAAAYQTTKAGIIGLTISMAGDLAEQRIRVNAIAPGQVWTPIAAAFLTPEVREERRRSGLLQEEGAAWGVAWGAVYLASDEARWVTTGHVLAIDAGVTLTMRGGTTF
jgi:choline dehydrogenase-like flavoprotein